MGESQCAFCGAITPCPHGMSAAEYATAMAAYWTKAAETLNAKGFYRDGSWVQPQTWQAG